MADERKTTVIIETEIEVDESIESINKLKAANKELTAERNKLNIATEEGRKRAAEINVQIDANTNKIKANSSSLEKQRFNVGNYTASIVEASKQIKALEEENKKLAVAIRTVDKSTEEGKDQYNQLNQAIQNNITQINVYNQTIDKTTSSGQKAAASFKQLAPGLSNAAQGFMGMTRAALAFIATPIGAVIAALVAVFGLLKAAISTNDTAMDKFENITNAVGVVLDVVITRVGKLGQALIALSEGNFAEAAKLTGQAFSGLADEIANAVTQGQLYLDLSRELEDAQRALRIETSRTENEIKRLVVASKNRSLSLDEQEGFLRRALVLEEQLVAKRAENAQKDLVIAAKQLALSRQIGQTEEETFDQFVNRLLTGGVIAGEELDKLVDKIEALEQARGSSLAFQEKLENNLTAIQEKRAEALEKQNKALEEQAAQERAVRRAQNIESTEVEDPLVGAFQTRANLIGDIDKQMKEDLKERQRAYNEFQIDQAAKTAKVEVEIERQKVAVIGNLAGSLSEIVEQETVAFKILASAQAVINTWLAATAALASDSSKSGIFGILSAAAVVANGLAAVAKINGVEFAEGGYTGPGPKHKPAGTVHAGEVVWNQEDVKSVGGPAIANAMRPTAKRMHAPSYGRYLDGGVVTTGISQPINQQLELLNIVKNMPQPVVAVKEITKVQRRVAVKEQISKR